MPSPGSLPPPELRQTPGQGSHRLGTVRYAMGYCMVGVAQLVELLVVVQAVVGSSPIAHPSCTPAGVVQR